MRSIWEENLKRLKPLYIIQSFLLGLLIICISTIPIAHSEFLSGKFEDKFTAVAVAERNPAGNLKINPELIPELIPEVNPVIISDIDTERTTNNYSDINLFDGSKNLNFKEILLTLEQIPVKGRAPKTGYSRAAFGPQWSDIDRNGCDTRNDILKRDLTNIIYRAKTRDCVVENGKLLDPFSNTVIDFIRGERTSMLVQIDHVVSLSNAWQTGIFKATLKTRTEFANDPLNLLAVKGSLNSQKGDGDAATWLPPNKSFRCDYVALQIKVKSKYELWVTKSEKDAMIRVLGSCS
ncbi:MAG: hypothetical protein RLZZ159_1236 [Actinomycetota bacterium]